MLLGFGLFLAACTSEGLPANFADQDSRVERQFVASCENALTDDADATSFCQCAFYTAAAELGFEDFIALDEALQENPDGLTFEQRELFEGVSLPCQFSAADVPS